MQWRSQNAEKKTHAKGKLLEQAVILFDCVPFIKWELLLWGNNFLPEERILSGKSSSLWYGKSLLQTYHIRWPPLNVTIFITHWRICVMGATPMPWTNFSEWGPVSYMAQLDHDHSRPLSARQRNAVQWRFTDPKMYAFSFCFRPSLPGMVNSTDPDKTPRFVVSHLDPRCPLGKYLWDQLH